MAEPTTNAAAGVTYATGAITLTGSIFGLQYDALLFGLFGGLISLMHLKPMAVMRLVGTLGSASLLGALFGPAAAAAAASWVWLAGVPPNLPRLGAALLVGLFFQTMIPLGLSMLERFGGAKGGPT